MQSLVIIHQMFPMLIRSTLESIETRHCITDSVGCCHRSYAYSALIFSKARSAYCLLHEEAFNSCNKRMVHYLLLAFSFHSLTPLLCIAKLAKENLFLFRILNWRKMPLCPLCNTPLTSGRRTSSWFPNSRAT